MPTSTRPSVVRLLKIHQALAERTYPTLERMAEECEVGTRTIKRDLKMLREELGAPVEFSREHQGYTYTREFNLASLTFSEGELLALCMLMAITDVFRNTPFAPAINRALRKLQLLLPEPAQMTQLDDSRLLSRLPDPAPPERVETIIIFNELLRALEAHRQVRMTYYAISRDAESTRVVDPYHLYYHRGMWYLHAYCHLRRETREFALGRIKSLELLTATFPAPDPQVIQEKMAARFAGSSDACMEVAVWFDAEEARWIRERVWHASQRIDDHPDGSCTLTMRVDGLSSVARWVLSFGCHARPLAPPALVATIDAHVRAMAAARQAVASPFTGEGAPTP